MLKHYMKKRYEEEEGFTLIELMVVVLIIGILIAIALPTFLGARTRAQDKAALSNLRNGIAAAKVYFTDKDTYDSTAVGGGPFVGVCVAPAACGQTIEPSLTWTDGAGVAQDTVDVGGVTTTQVTLSTLSASGSSFCITDDSQVGTYIGVDTAGGNIPDDATCRGLPAA